MNCLSTKPTFLMWTARTGLAQERQTADLGLAVAMPRLKHQTDPPAMLRVSVAELGALGAELAA